MKLEYDKTPYFSITESEPFFVLGRRWKWIEVGGTSVYQRIKGYFYRLIN